MAGQGRKTAVFTERAAKKHPFAERTDDKTDLGRLRRRKRECAAGHKTAQTGKSRTAASVRNEKTAHTKDEKSATGVANGFCGKGKFGSSCESLSPSTGRMGRPGCSGKREIPECRRQVRLGTGRSCVSSSPRAFSAFRYFRHECEVSFHYDSEPAIRRRPPTEIRSGQAERVSRLSVGPPVFRTPTNSSASAIRPARHRFPGSGIRRRRRDISFFAFVRCFRRPVPQKPQGGRQPESGHIRTPPPVSPRSGGFFRQIEPNEVPSQP